MIVDTSTLNVYNYGNGALCVPLLSTCCAEPPTDLAERQHIHFLRFHHLTAAKDCLRAGAAHLPPMTPRPRRQIVANEQCSRSDLREVGSFPHKTPLFGFEGSVFFASSSRVRASGAFLFFLHLFTLLLQRNDCQCVWCEGFCILPSPSASHSRSPPNRTKSLLFSGIIFKSPKVPTRNSRR